MTLAQVPSGSEVFVDANILVYHFGPDPAFGPVCSQFLNRVYTKDLKAVSSSHVVAEMVHRLMTIEAMKLMNWPPKGIGNRLRKNPAVVRKLGTFVGALQDIAAIGVQVVAVDEAAIVKSAQLSIQHGLLSNDALILAVMELQGVKNLASHDADFDAVPTIVRYAPG